MALADAAALAATVAYQRRLDLLSALLTERIGETFARFATSGRTDRSDLDDWFGAVTPGIAQVSRQVSAVADGFGALLLDRPTTGYQGAVFGYLADVDVPFLRMWGALGNGERFDDAVRTGAGASEIVAIDAVQSTARHTVGHAYPDVRYQRVMEAAACEWCAVVSTQSYASPESATFGHDRCKCDVIPTSTSGRILNRRRYEQLGDAGAIDRSSAARTAGRFDQRLARIAERRDAVLAQLAENPTRELAREAQRIDRDAQRLAAEAASARQSVKPGRPDGWTGYVDRSGRPAPRPVSTP